MRTYKPNTTIVINPQTSRVEIMTVWSSRDGAENHLQVSTEGGGDAYLWTGRKWIDIFGHTREFELIEKDGWNYITFPYEDLGDSAVESFRLGNGRYGSSDLETSEEGFPDDTEGKYLSTTTRLRQN